MRMELAVKYIILIVCLALAHDAVCTHFRGGTFTYKPVNPSDPANTTVGFVQSANHASFKQRSVQRLLPSRYQIKWHFICLPSFGKWKQFLEIQRLSSLYSVYTAKLLFAYIDPVHKLIPRTLSGKEEKGTFLSANLNKRIDSLNYMIT